MVISIAFSEVHRTGFPDVPSCACRSTLIPTARRNWHKSLKNFTCHPKNRPVSGRRVTICWAHVTRQMGYNKTRIVLKGTEVLEHFEVQI